MTQHSQSPPISQLRMVNGPTSFTNLLPKSTTRPITSPITQLQNGHHHHNNHHHDAKLLGKRKAEMDENDNAQMRRKVMRREPPSPVKPNNFISNVASPLMASLVPVVVQPTPPPPALPPQPILAPQKEPPKKRGRKKGSKGIDSMLNGAVPDFQAEIMQKIALSAGKRNKTTVELQQMLESNQNSALSWTNGDNEHNSVDRG